MTWYLNNIFFLESDVGPASIALLTQFKILRDNFGVEPMVCYGLPAFAQYAMFNLFDPSSASMFTFPQAFVHLVQLFRRNTFGGICNVYMRHATTMDEPDAAYAAKFNKSGNYHK